MSPAISDRLGPWRLFLACRRRRTCSTSATLPRQRRSAGPGCIGEQASVAFERLFQKRWGVRSGLPDELVIWRGRPIFVELTGAGSRRGSSRGKDRRRPRISSCRKPGCVRSLGHKSASVGSPGRAADAPATAAAPPVARICQSSTAKFGSQHAAAARLSRCSTRGVHFLGQAPETGVNAVIANPPGDAVLQS
jgi:hypothetical protein